MKNFKFTIKGHDYAVEIIKIEGTQAEIEVNGTPYLVDIHKEVKRVETPKLVRKAVPTPKDASEIKKAPDAHLTKMLAPLPGNIIQIMVKEGDNISKGSKILIMEAMKMENDVLSEKDGIVRTIRVKAGDTVLQGDVLVEIE